MNKGGRPPAVPGARRVNVPVRLPEWLVAWIDSKGTTRAQVIEDALVAVISADREERPVSAADGPHINCWALREVFFDEDGNPTASRAP